jgi:C1A family cysteine protease
MARHTVRDPLSLLHLRTKKHYGWNHDIPDERDHIYSAPLDRYAQGVPPKVDLRQYCPPVYDQGQLGSCTANAVAAALEFDREKQKLSDFAPSRLFIYYNERALEGTTGSDSGAQIRDGIKSVATVGACPETDWPYQPSQFAVQPLAACYADAKPDRALQYQRINQNLTQMQACLASGFPFVFGFTVYQSFESPAVATSGIMPMPAPGEQVLGGHAVMAVGYDNSTRSLIVRNSWGPGWGQAGYFMMPFEYVMHPHYTSDFWTIRSIG